MKDHRFVDDLSLKELERALLVKRRTARLARLRQMDRSTHKVGRDPLEKAPPSSVSPIPSDHLQYHGLGASAGYHTAEGEQREQRLLKGRLRDWLSKPLNIDWRFVLNGLLLIIEVAAMAGLVVVVVNARQDQERIQPAVDEVPTAPAPTFPPPVKAVVLPGGHTPPDVRGFSQPDAIPQGLRATAQAITSLPIPTRGPEHAMRLVIPAISIDHPVVEGYDWEALKRGVGHVPWSANPGNEGNCVLVAHNDIFGEVFRRLPEMELGDEIFVHTGVQRHRYVVQATRVVDPTQVEVMNPTDVPTLTLISSYPYLEDDRRIVIIAELAPSISIRS